MAFAAGGDTSQVLGPQDDDRDLAALFVITDDGHNNFVFREPFVRKVSEYPGELLCAFGVHLRYY